MFKQTDLMAIFGRRGTGKSTLCKSIQKAFPRLIVIDLLHEYTKKDCDYLVDDFETFGAVLVKLLEAKKKRFRVVYQFDVENSSDETEEFDRAMKLIYHFGNCMVVIEEIHHYMKREYMTEWLKKLVLVGRHRGVGLIATSQRPAEVSKTFVSQCHHVFAGVTFEKNDLKYFADTIGDASERLQNVKPFHFLHYQPGIGSQVVRNK